MNVLVDYRVQIWHAKREMVVLMVVSYGSGLLVAFVVQGKDECLLCSNTDWLAFEGGSSSTHLCPLLGIVGPCQLFAPLELPL